MDIQELRKKRDLLKNENNRLRSFLQIVQNNLENVRYCIDSNLPNSTNSTNTTNIESPSETIESKTVETESTTETPQTKENTIESTVQEKILGNNNDSVKDGDENQATSLRVELKSAFFQQLKDISNEVKTKCDSHREKFSNLFRAATERVEKVSDN